MSGIDVAALVAGILLGSIPFPWLLVRLTTKQDVAQAGSANVGALNAMRVARSPWVGVAVLVLDALKGAAAVVLARTLGAEPGLGLIGVVAGHCYNPWLSLRARRVVGGKGFAAAAGAMLVIYPILVACWLVVGLVAWEVFLLWRDIRDEAPASALATIGVVPCAAWFHDGRTAIVMAVAAALILPKMVREVRTLLFRRPTAD